MLPSFETKTHKRKLKDDSTATSAKKGCVEKDRNTYSVNSCNNNSTSSFRIPKISQGQSGFDRKNKTAGSGQHKSKVDGPKGRGAGRGLRKQ